MHDQGTAYISPTLYEIHLLEASGCSMDCFVEHLCSLLKADNRQFTVPLKERLLLIPFGSRVTHLALFSQTMESPSRTLSAVLLRPSRPWTRIRGSVRATSSTGAICKSRQGACNAVIRCLVTSYLSICLVGFKSVDMFCCMKVRCRLAKRCLAVLCIQSAF